MTTNQWGKVTSDIRDITLKLANDPLSENTRKARRMLLLYSFIGIVWSTGVGTGKIAPGGIEVFVKPGLIPFALLTLCVFFLVQFWLYLFTDYDRTRYLHAELRRLSKEHDLQEQRILIPVPLDLNLSMDDVLVVIGWPRAIWDYLIPTLIAFIAIVGLIGRAFFGWFTGTPTAPFIPHIPAWAPLWQ